MAQIIPDYQLAAGNDNDGGLTLLTSITDANGIAFVMPRGLPGRLRGERRIRLDSTDGRIGFSSTQWEFSAITVAQYSLLLGTYEGLVTIRIALSGTTFANYNAVLSMPDERDLTYIPNLLRLGKQIGSIGGLGPGYSDVICSLRKLEAL